MADDLVQTFHRDGIRVWKQRGVSLSIGWYEIQDPGGGTGRWNCEIDFISGEIMGRACGYNVERSDAMEARLREAAMQDWSKKVGAMVDAHLTPESEPSQRTGPGTE